MWVLAEREIQAPKILASEGVQATLVLSPLHAEHTGNVVAVPHYVYENTCQRLDSTKDSHSLVTDYTC